MPQGTALSVQACEGGLTRLNVDDIPPPKDAPGAADAADGATPNARADEVLAAGAALRPKESPFPKGEAAAFGAADACCPSPPNAPKPDTPMNHF